MRRVLPSLVPSPFLCVHAREREVNVYASARILEFHYVTFSQVVVVSDYVSVRIIIPTWRRERVNSDGFSLQSVWQCFGEC